MTQAQMEALNLLRLLDEICQQEKINYTLGNRALMNYEAQQSDEYLDPNGIYVCLLYEDYVRLLNLLEESAAVYGIEIITYQNMTNFDALSAWVLRSGKNVLPVGREEDECYYKTRIILTPMFYAGNTKQECRKNCKLIEHQFNYIDCRWPLEHKHLFGPIKNKIIRTKQRYYCRNKHKYNYCVHGLIEELKAGTYGKEYLVYKDIENTCAWMRIEEFVTERINFYGVAACAIRNKKGFLERNYKDLLLDDWSNKVSELQLKGGRDLRRVQLIQLELMKEIDRICRKHHLKYNIAFGTLLGAVRHGGFVPWDDDADINMPYEDYLKLIDVVEDEIDHEKYYFRYQDKEADCNITYAHFKRNGTVYTKRNREGFKYHPGVFIDIVPLFNGAPNFFLHKIQTRICSIFRTACWAYVGADSERNPLMRVYYQLLAKIGNKRAYRLCIKAATFFTKKRNKMLFLNALDRDPYNIAFVRRECFDDPIELDFEGHKFFAPRDVHGVLDYCYGHDYMKYLPLARRVPKNDALIELGDLYSDI